MAIPLYNMRNKITVPLAVLICTGSFLVILMYQIWDLKREIRTYVPLNPCTPLLPSRSIRIHKLPGCEKTQSEPSNAKFNMRKELPRQLSASIDSSKTVYVPVKGKPESGASIYQNAVIQRKVCPNRLQVFILVSSHYSHIDRRTSIRSTWGVDGSILLRWSTLFVLAQGRNATKMMRAVAEQRIYRDIVIGGFEEGFYKLSRKVEFGLHWALTYCQFDYLLKADDDVFVNVPRLISFVQLEATPQKKLYSGNVHYRAFVERSGRYGVPKEDYPKPIYPRYCSGGGFVLSVDVVTDLVEKIQLFPDRRRLIIDDAYVGELALEAGIDVYPSRDFLMFEKGCNFKSRAIVFHPVKESGCMKKLYIMSMAPTKSVKRVNPSTSIAPTSKLIKT